MKLQNNDYKGMDPQVALADFKERVKVRGRIRESTHTHTHTYIHTHTHT